MRTISERRHFDACAVQRQLRIAAVMACDESIRKIVTSQPHRLSKRRLASVQDPSGTSSNPRRGHLRLKDRLSSAEHSAHQRFRHIEIRELFESGTIRRLAEIDTGPASTSRMLT